MARNNTMIVIMGDFVSETNKKDLRIEVEKECRFLRLVVIDVDSLHVLRLAVTMADHGNAATNALLNEEVHVGIRHQLQLHSSHL